jgi:hypothetical protein
MICQNYCHSGRSESLDFLLFLQIGSERRGTGDLEVRHGTCTIVSGTLGLHIDFNLLFLFIVQSGSSGVPKSFHPELLDQGLFYQRSRADVDQTKA